MNPQAIIAILKNEETQKFHPILYLYSPLPGGADVPRYQSKGHHTNGFVFREEALSECIRLAGKSTDHFGLTCLNVKTDLSWDGAEIPADRRFFTISECVLFSPTLTANEYCR